MTKMNKLVAGAGLCLALMGANASAVLISFANYGVGYWDPANEFNGDGDLPAGVQRSIDIWNGDASEGLFDPPGNDDATFTKGNGALLPVTLPDVLAYVSRDEGSPFQVDNTLGLYSYMTAKYGNSAQQVFYIGGIHDIITVQGKLNGTSGPGLSHLSWLTAEPVITTPDGGATLVLFGTALAGLGCLNLLRRKS